MELEDRLEEIFNLVSDYEASGKDYAMSIQKLFNQIKALAEEKVMEATPVTKEDVTEKIIISCDASITKNPGGIASAAYVIAAPGKAKVMGGRKTPSKTINEAEYDAIYEGLQRLALEGRVLNPIVVYSDSKLVVSQLSGKWKINLDTLKNKCQSVHALAAKIGVPVEIRWAPRNSTEDLKNANFHAQDLLGVPRH